MSLPCLLSISSVSSCPPPVYHCSYFEIPCSFFVYSIFSFSTLSLPYLWSMSSVSFLPQSSSFPSVLFLFCPLFVFYLLFVIYFRAFSPTNVLLCSLVFSSLFLLSSFSPLFYMFSSSLIFFPFLSNSRSLSSRHPLSLPFFLPTCVLSILSILPYSFPSFFSNPRHQSHFPSLSRPCHPFLSSHVT